MDNLNKGLVNYIESKILPLYTRFDLSHDMNHANEVIDRALYLSKFYDVDKDIVYTSAAYHDLGLKYGRDNHELRSSEIVRSDKNLKNWFIDDEIELVANAVEDHRSSSDHSPRGIYGKILCEADRVIDSDRTLRRVISYGISNYPDKDKNWQVDRAIRYITEKYGRNGRVKIYLPESPNKSELLKLQSLIYNKSKFMDTLDSIYDEITNSYV